MIFSIISSIIYFFGKPLSLYLSLKILISNLGSYFEWIKLYTHILPFTILFAVIPIFFIIKRLQTTNPNKVFYLELPILIAIYSFTGVLNITLGLSVGGPDTAGMGLFILLLLSPIIFAITWLGLITLSAYYYIKKEF